MTNAKQQKIKKDYIAYFTMELGLDASLPTYSGGLGVLAGDTLKSMADLDYPFVAITMLNEKGYFEQKISKDHEQIENSRTWSKEKFLKKTPFKVKIKIENRDVWIRAWKYNNQNKLYPKNLNIYYLDTNLPENSKYDRELTSYLYGGDREYRICQEIILGIGGFRMLAKLGYSQIKKYHINEGHAAFLGLELLKTKTKMRKNILKSDIEYVKEKCAFTTHTPIAAGHDTFDIVLVKKIIGNYIPKSIFEKSIDENKKFNMTMLALNTSSFVNGVAKRHEAKTRTMFPDYRIFSITNGIHSSTWVSKYMNEVFEKHLGDWKKYPYNLRYAKSIPTKEIRNAHKMAKKDLLAYIFKENKIKLKESVITIGFARRFTAYKRSGLIFYDMKRLREIADKSSGLQIVMSGKAHPNDDYGKAMIKTIIGLQNEVNKKGSKLKLVFLENYNIEIAKLLVSGCDVWLNNPQRPYEASGTSGMKAALNGVPHLSTMDGWWLEGCVEGATGWGIGPIPNSRHFNKDLHPDDEAHDLYKKLEFAVLASYYHDKEEWMEIMANCIAINASFFNSYRMVQEYINHVY